MLGTPLQSMLSVALSATDAQKSVDFYTKGLGFKVVEHMERNGKLQGAMITAGQAHLGISQDDFSKGRDREKGTGFSIHLETEQDLATLVSQAKVAGIPFEHELGPLPWGPTGFSVKDPDGFTVFVTRPMR